MFIKNIKYKNLLVEIGVSSVHSLASKTRYELEGIGISPGLAHFAVKLAQCSAISVHRRVKQSTEETTTLV